MKIWYNNENTVKLPKYDIHKSGGSNLDSKLLVEKLKNVLHFFRTEDLIYGSFMMGSPQACGNADVLWQGNLDPTKIIGTILRKQA